MTMRTSSISHRSSWSRTDESTGRIDGINGEPDIISIDSTSANLIVEVETREAIAENGNHVLDQLQDYPTSGFKRVLVVPDDVVEACSQVGRNKRRPRYPGGINYSCFSQTDCERPLVSRATNLSGCDSQRTLVPTDRGTLRSQSVHRLSHRQ